MRHSCFSSGVLPFSPVPAHLFVLPYLVLNTQDEVYADQAAFFFYEGSERAISLLVVICPGRYRPFYSCLLSDLASKW